MQNLSNATTKIQLNSIPEKKTSKRETFFPIWETREATPRKKDMKMCCSQNLPPTPVVRR